MTVTDLAGRPIEGATVRAIDGHAVATSRLDLATRVLHGAPVPPVVEARTDAAGRATLPPTECPVVAVTAPGGGTSLRFVGRRTEGRSSCDELFRLGPGFSLSGRVRDEDGRAVPHADVAVLLRGRGDLVGGGLLLPHARCDDDGAFVIAGIGPGDHRLAVRVPGRQWIGAVRFRAPGVERIDVCVPPTGGLEGTVTDATTGGPVAGARVWVSPPAFWLLTQFGAETDASGRYRFDGVAAGLHYDLWAEAPGFAPARAVRDDAGSEGVVPGGTLRQDFVLSRGANVEGTVTCDGAPVADAEVEVAVRTNVSNDPQSIRTTTADDGTWCVAGLGAGAAVVIVRHAAFTQPDEPSPWSAGDTDLPGADRHAFTVPATGTVRRDVTLVRTAERTHDDPAADVPEPMTLLRGRVVGPDGAPLPGSVVGVCVRVPGCGRGRQWFGWDDIDTTLVRDRTSPWDVSLPRSPQRGRRAWYLAFAVTFEGGYAESALHRVPTRSDVADLVFRVGPPVRLEGRVVRAGVAVDGAHIHVIGPRDGLKSLGRRLDGAPEPDLDVHGVAGPDGRFSVPVARPGRYAVHVQTDDYAAALRRHVLVPGAPVEIELPEVQEIHGEIVWPDETPCAGMMVAVSGVQDRHYGLDTGCVEGRGWAMSRADGTFRLRGVAPGASVQLEVGRHRTGGMNVPTGWTGPVDPGARDVRLAVTPGRSLSGRVVSPQGVPLSDVVVMAWSGAEFDRSALQAARTDAAGGFIVSALWPPPWHVEAYTLHRDALADRGRGVPEIRVLYSGTYDDSGPVELVLDVPGASPPRDGDRASSP